MTSSTRACGTVFALVAVIVVATLELPQLDRPPFDNFNHFRQSQTLGTIELFDERGIDLLRPPTNYVGEPGVLVLELPLFQAAAALLRRAVEPSVAIVRAANLIVTLASAALVVLIGRRLVEPTAAILAALIYLVSPLNLGYMTSLLMDPLAVLFALAAFHAALVAADDPRGSGLVRHPWFGALAAIAALMKALYLFPVLVLLVVTALRGESHLRAALRLCLWMLPAGLGLLLWTRHASEVNDASYFTMGIAPLGLLGVSGLSSADWWLSMGKRLFGWSVGPVAGVLAVAGWAWAVLDVLRRRPAGASGRLMMLTSASVVGYWLAFADINMPHYYYSLIAVPFLALASADVMARLAATARAHRAVPAFVVLGLAAAGASVAFFLQRSGGMPFAPEPHLLALRDKAGQSFRRHEFAMVFIHEDRGPKLTAALEPVPAAMIALGLRGTAVVVQDGHQALSIWGSERPHYRHLRYVVFYGLPPEPEIVREFPQQMLSDDAVPLYGFTHQSD